MQNLDILFITADNSKAIYQSLSNNYSAIEPPTWSLLLAQSCRSVGYNVAILDANAEKITHQQILDRIGLIKPRLLCFVVYGQNVNSGTTSMDGATSLSKFLKKNNISIPITFLGSHVQALPVETLKKEQSIDIVITNEGVYALRNLLKLDKFIESNLDQVKGIGFRKNGNPHLTLPESVVPQEKMDIDLPGYAWDLLPYKNKPFDLYRSPMWHAEYDENKRTPYAALQTSLGCRFGCEFCMINMINRNDNDPIGIAGNYSNMRYWSPEFIIKEFDKLIEMGVETIRIVDEMFLLNPKYYIPLCNLLAERNKKDNLRMWAYSRIDTIKRPGILDLVRKSGIKWLCLGIESSKKEVRLEISKGKFEDVDIKKVVQQVHESDIEVMANYIYGLPGDNEKTINETFELSLDLCTSGWNTYAAMALPGSHLYKLALQNNHKLPEDYAGYSWHSYNTQNLPTKDLTAAKILKIRDENYKKYHEYKPFLDRIKGKFGEKAVNNILEMSKIELKRKICEEENLY